jgi:eukaryotic-like serine/threonine-protein kinase
MKYHAFISYSHADKAWAEWLHRGVETYRLPREVREEKEGLPERFFPVFRDRDELAGASVLGERLREALRESRFLIVVCSPRAAKSEWVAKEVGYFKQLGRSEQVLCLIVDGIPKATLRQPDEAERECFPSTILHPVDEEGEPILNLWEEPLAADARPGGDGKRAAMLKIIAGMAGVGFGDLVRRDQQRAIRRLRWLVAGVGALVLAFAALGTGLYFQKKEAVRQRDMARSVRNGAQDLNNFIILDLRSKLRDLGRLDLLEDVTGRVLAYHAKLPGELADDPAVLRSRAIAMDYSGQQAMSRGDAAGAVRLLEQSGRAWQDLMERADAGDEAPQGYAVSAKMLAEAYARTGDIKGAVAICEKGLAGLAAWAGADENRKRIFRRQAAMLLTEKGDGLRRMGRSEEALETISEATALARAAVELEPDDPKALSQLAECFSKLSAIHREGGDLASALAMARSAVETAEAFAEIDLGNATGWRLVVVCEAERFAVLGGMSDWLEAEKSAVDRLGWISRLRGRDPSNPNLAGMEGRGRDDLGMALGKLIRIEEAVSEFQKAVELFADLVVRYPTDAKWREDLAIVFRRRGDLAFDGEVWEVALEDYESSLRMRDSLIRLAPSDTRLRVMAADIVLAKAEVFEKTGKRSEALAALDEAEKRLGNVERTAAGPLFLQVLEGISGARADWTTR